MKLNKSHQIKVNLLQSKGIQKNKQWAGPEEEETLLVHRRYKSR